MVLRRGNVRMDSDVATKIGLGYYDDNGWGVVRAIGNHKQIDVYADNGFALTNNGASCAIYQPETPQHAHIFDIQFPTDVALPSKVNIYKRASRFDFQPENAINMEISQSGTKFYLGSRLVRESEEPKILSDERYMLAIVEHGKWNQFILGCDTIARIESYLPASENTILSISGGDTCSVRFEGLGMVSLRDDNRNIFKYIPSTERPYPFGL
ncbi:MAG: hypothetical protein Kapaf2KO_00620 [Candidatus Kapaibacteriales bacterium]